MFDIGPFEKYNCASVLIKLDFNLNTSKKSLGYNVNKNNKMTKFKVLKQNKTYMTHLGIYSDRLNEPKNEFFILV